MNNNYYFFKGKFIRSIKINSYKFLIEGFSLKNATLEDIYKEFNIKKIYFANQVHGGNIIEVTNINKNKIEIMEGDALVTKEPNIAIGVKVADCIATSIVDIRKKIIAVVHSGWRGIKNKIIQKVINFMIIHYNTRKEDLIISMSPAIGVCCYEVGDELYRDFKKEKIFNNIFAYKKNKIFMDLYRANINILKDIGIYQNIFINNLCTYCNKNLFFSYRRDRENTGRMVQFLMIKGHNNE